MLDHQTDVPATARHSVVAGHETSEIDAPATGVTTQVAAFGGSVEAIALPLASPARQNVVVGQSIEVIVRVASTFFAADHVNGPAAPAGAAKSR